MKALSVEEASRLSKDELAEYVKWARTEIEERIDLIASKISLREPFVSAVFSKLERKFKTYGTAGTNGAKVEFGAIYCASHTEEELMGLCLHEALHVVLMHMWRRRNREHMRYNLACDAVVDRTLEQMGYGPIRDAVTYDWLTDEMSVEDVYAKLQQDPEQGQGYAFLDGPPDDTAGGACLGGGDVRDSNDPSAELDMEATIKTAAKMTKACGKGSALIDLVLEGGLDPKASWKELLRHVLTASRRDDYTFGRVNKRFVSAGLYLPSLHTPGIGTLIVGIDTSGSMGQEELNQIASEITAIAQDCRPETVLVIYCDSEVVGTERFDAYEDIQLHAKGGGGTRFKPVFDYIEEQVEETPAALVYFTDLWGNTDELDPPDYPVVWGVTYNSDRAVPFGDVASLW